ncbi:autotransporter outer membrane beta-barrel domain-containing protein, partial [Marinobacter salexigens]
EPEPEPETPIETFALAGMSHNQTVTADAAFTLGAGHGVYDRVLNMSEAQAFAAMSRLSGEIHTGTRSHQISGAEQVRHAALQRMNGAQDPSRGLWFSVLGQNRELDGDDHADLDSEDYGLLIGVDGQLGNGWRLGLFGGGSTGEVSLGGQDAASDNETLYLGAYASQNWNALRLNLGLGYGRGAVETERRQVLGQTLRADYDVSSLLAFSELGYRLAFGGHWLEPYGGVSWVSLSSDSAQEQGGSAALRIDSQNSDTGFSTLGLRGGTDVAVGESQVNLHGGVGWKYAFGDRQPESRQTFVDGGSRFTIQGAPLARHTAEVEVGVSVQVSSDSTLGLSYQGEMSRDADSQGVSLDWALRF